MFKEELIEKLNELPENTKIYLMNFLVKEENNKEGAIIEEFELELSESFEGDEFAVIAF